MSLYSIRVMKARAKGIIARETTSIVAVKMLKGKIESNYNFVYFVVNMYSLLCVYFLHLLENQRNSVKGIDAVFICDTDHCFAR